MTQDTPRIAVGSRLSRGLTVLGTVDDRGEDPVYLVWNHDAWCPMACKSFRSIKYAQREASTLSSLAHPNIVRYFGLSDPNNLLMEYLEGPTLSRLRRCRPKRRLSLSDALRIGIHLGAALQHVHERGFLHMDVKPSNVVLAHGRPVLFDFGIARPRSDARPGRAQGTDGYMAPEECERAEVATAADVFSLAVTLYELIAGERPYPEPTEAEPYPQIRLAPTPLRHHRPGLPASLERLILKCLDRDPAARPRLATLLPTLHRQIRAGPPMWPASFCPDESAPAKERCEPIDALT